MPSMTITNVRSSTRATALLFTVAGAPAIELSARRERMPETNRSRQPAALAGTCRAAWPFPARRGHRCHATFNRLFAEGSTLRYEQISAPAFADVDSA